MGGYEIVWDGGQVRVMLDEHLTAAHIPELQPRLKEAVTSGVQEVIFDMARTVSVDSTGIGLLIATYNSVSGSNGQVRVSNVAPDILKLFKSMRLADRLHATAAHKE